MSKPSLNLEMIGVPLGAILTFNDNESITCIVIGASFYNGSSYYWRFGDETLHDRRRPFEAYHRSE